MPGKKTKDTMEYTSEIRFLPEFERLPDEVREAYRKLDILQRGVREHVFNHEPIVRRILDLSGRPSEKKTASQDFFDLFQQVEQLTRPGAGQRYLFTEKGQQDVVLLQPKYEGIVSLLLPLLADRLRTEANTISVLNRSLRESQRMRAR